MWWTLIKIIAGGGVILAAYAWLTNGAWDRGYRRAHTEMQAVLDRQEKELRHAIKKNEGLSDPELDCRLGKLRKPEFKCPVP